MDSRPSVAMPLLFDMVRGKQTDTMRNQSKKEDPKLGKERRGNLTSPSRMRNNHPLRSGGARSDSGGTAAAQDAEAGAAEDTLQRNIPGTLRTEDEVVEGIPDIQEPEPEPAPAPMGNPVAEGMVVRTLPHD